MTTKTATVALFLLDNLATILLETAKAQPAPSTAIKKKGKKHKEADDEEAVIDAPAPVFNDSQLNLFIMSAKGALSGLADLGQPLQRRSIIDNLKGHLILYRGMSAQLVDEVPDHLKNQILNITSLVNTVLEAPEYKLIVELLVSY